ncbi:MAG: 3-oxoacyl-[acyl-carrier-protein] reductase [Calditrichaeota bacterium]|nr:3-oxoacyl-[acyl-carrier-protein] reductase [Calditrichota bacterium]
MRLKDRVAIVTGSTRGIGEAIARAFAREGAWVVIVGRNGERAEKVAAEIREQGGQAMAVVADVSRMEDAQNLVKQTLDTWGKIDILVNNAGITRDNLLLRMSEAEWDEVLNINLKGAFNCTKSVVRQMMKQRQGRIINITSVVGQMGNAGQANYAASKAGLIGFTRSVARELASRNITCNAIAPGYIETDMTAALDEPVREALQKQIPLNRLGQAEDVARVAVFLASDDAAYITGQVINVDGGMVMA